MKFAILARALCRPGFGIQTLLDCFIDGLSTLETQHEIVLLVPPNFELELPRNLSTLSVHKCGHSVTGSFGLVFWDHIAAGRHCGRLKCDAMFAPSHVTPLYSPVPIVTCIPDMMYDLFPEDWSFPERAYIWTTGRLLARKAAHLITISESSKRDIISRLGADPNDITVIYPGCPPSFVPASPLEIEKSNRKFGLLKPYFMAIGSRHPRKNIQLLLNAFAGVRRSHDIQLILTGSSFGRIKSGCFELPEGVRHLGNVDRSDIPSLLSGSLGLVFPTRYEGFGFPALEAMACGTPLIAANASSIPEIVGDAAILVPPNDQDELERAMNFILSTPEAVATTIDNGIKRAAGFTNAEFTSGIIRELELAANCAKSRQASLR